MDDEERRESARAALAILEEYGMIDGAHHKQWVMDQAIRRLLGKGYAEWRAQNNEYARQHGYPEWDEGIAP